MITNIQTIDLKNVGIIKGKLNSQLLEIIKNEVNSIANDFSKARSWNKELAGHIRKEFLLEQCCDEVEKAAVNLAIDHNNKYDYINSLYSNLPGSRFRLKLENLWVNFQERYEFNPLHRHRGLYSFVIWIDIPYFFDFENSISPGFKSTTNRSGYFEFVYTDILGNIRGECIPADKAYEGDIVLFPSPLHHMVHPFYSTDKKRISIAGNLEAVTSDA